MNINHVGVPSDKTLPFFTYGIFKPGQIAYGRIKRYVDGEPIEYDVEYEMSYRDGVPLIEGEKNPNFSTKGFLINFNNPERAYKILAKAEREELYEWGIIDVNGINANALIGKNTGCGCFDNHENRNSNYDYRKDSFFNEARDLIKECVDEYKSIEKIDMYDFFIIQMHYMLLWSVIERFCTFKYGYFGIGGNKFNFAREKVFENSLKNIEREDTIFSSDTLKDSELDSEDYEESIEYYYTIRCNVVHKGKTVKKEDNIKLKLSLEELFGLFEAVYKDTLNKNNQEQTRLNHH